MNGLTPAIGFLRSDVSGAREQWDRSDIARLASALGYDLVKIVTLGPHTDRPMYRLQVQLSRLGASTLVTPSLDHFAGEIPAEIREMADVITVQPEETHRRLLKTAVQITGITFAVSPEVDALLGSAAEIAYAAGQTGICVDHILLALLRKPEAAAEPLRRIGIGADVYGERLARLAHVGQPS